MNMNIVKFYYNNIFLNFFIKQMDLYKNSEEGIPSM